jgi:hypothetical protein
MTLFKRPFCLHSEELNSHLPEAMVHGAGSWYEANRVCAIHGPTSSSLLINFGSFSLFFLIFNSNLFQKAEYLGLVVFS